MKSTFSVIYYLKRQVVKKDGTVPVMGRITVDGSQTQFSCKLSVDPKLWDTKGGRVTGRSAAALETNRMLDKMRVRINRHYQEIMERDNFVTAEKVKNAFLGLEHRYHTLMQVFRRHNENYEKQVEAGRSYQRNGRAGRSPPAPVGSPGYPTVGRCWERPPGSGCAMHLEGNHHRGKRAPTPDSR